MIKLRVGDVVQFAEKHKWAGCFGFVNEAKMIGHDERYMIGVPVPQGGTAYIFTMRSREEVEKVGKAILMPAKDEES